MDTTVTVTVKTTASIYFLITVSNKLVQTQHTGSGSGSVAVVVSSSNRPIPNS